jgi:hypothetical protein
MNTENNPIQNEIRPGTDRELKVHDGIVGSIILLSIVLGMYVNPVCFWLAGAVAVLMISSAFTGFCPVHFILSKVMPKGK